MGKKKAKSKVSKPAPTVSEPALNDLDLIAAAISSATQAVFMKVCRLCESKDGPFLNIFDADKVTAKKIDEVMPFKIAENDDLPHKICFRCSAKVEELYEFIQKCIKTQESLNTALGRKNHQVTKTKTRTLWEEKLNKSNISNDDICNALIQKAMEGIKDIPLKPLPDEGDTAVKKEKKPPTTHKKQSKVISEDKSEPDDDKDMSLKQLKASLDKYDEKFIPKRTSRSQNPEALLDGLPDYKRNISKSKKQKDDTKEKEEDKAAGSSNRKKKVVKISSSEEECSSDLEIETTPPTPHTVKKDDPKPDETPKPFNIMDHVSTIKVNGVGILFQCKLCNRNFLKKDVVMSHGCSKSGGVPKIDFTKNIIRPDPPRASVVKYINTKEDGELGQSVEDKTAKTEIEAKKPEVKPKPKIGPASKVKRDENNPIIGMAVAPIEEPPEKPPAPVETPPAPSLQLPIIPSLNSRYKLVPGPNNTFHLVEEPNASAAEENDTSTKSSKKRKNEETIKSTDSKHGKNGGSSSKRKDFDSDVIDLENTSEQPEDVQSRPKEQPYPVGLFSTVPHHSSMYPTPPTPVPEPTFTTPAMKKQSYTIVQTGNPSKLLISTKPQPPMEEPQKKRQKRSKHEVKEDSHESRQPFNVTLEDAVRPKDAFFTFINVDPLLQPSYVLPTDNIIQESQISTSTPQSKGNTDSKDKDKYSCNMCNEKFSREKKLLAHIHSHYNKMDEEDMIREKNRKRSKK